MSKKPCLIEEYLKQGHTHQIQNKKKREPTEPLRFYLSLFSSLNEPLSPRELRNLFSIANTILLSLDFFNLSIVLCAIINLFLAINYIFQIILPLV